jgi:hypothetical protein
MRRIRSAITALTCGAFAGMGLAKPVDMQMGSRGFGMGGAFAAISDDATATYWNPAGLAQLGSLTLSETNWILQDVSDVNVNYFTGAVPISQVGTVAGGWLMQFANLEQGEAGTALYQKNSAYDHTFSLAAGRELWKKLWIFENTSLGFSLDRYVFNSGADNGAGTGFDLGFLTRFPRGIRLGFVMRSLGADMMGDKQDPEFRLGLGYVWQGAERHRVTVAADVATKENVEYDNSTDGVDRNYKGFFGAEYMFHQDEWTASARAGLNSGFINSRDMMAYTGGVGIGYRGFNLEYAYQYNANTDVSLGQSHRVTFEVRLGEFMKKDQAAASAPAAAAPAASATVADMPMGDNAK